MTKAVAYRMIKDDLSLDGNPTLNLASFVTTYMEEEAEKLMVYGISTTINSTVSFANQFPATPSPKTSSTTKNTPSPPTSKTAASP